MDRIWQWVWDRHGPHYSWAIGAVLLPLMLPIFLLPSFCVVALEGSDRYVETVAVNVVAGPVLVYVLVLPGLGLSRIADRWAAGQNIDAAQGLDSTYRWGRRTIGRAVVGTAVWAALLLGVVGGIAGATGSRLVHYGIMGAALGTSVQLIGVHSFVEAALRPVRSAIAGGTGMGDSLPRSRPSFATWAKASMLGVAFVFTFSGALLMAVFGRAGHFALLSLVIAIGMILCFGIPITVAAVFAPSLRPIRDLAEGTERVAAGDYSRRLPVVQDDDLGALAASFNRMQTGLAERQRLQSAFGTYVDPALAARLLEQGDDVFTGERREVSVMFVDIRDFTPFAEANSAEDTVARLNALFEIVVPAVVEAGGHVNKFLGDGALAVFGAPNDVERHADSAVSAAVSIHRLVAERFDGALRIGIGINTGKVIAGTIGGGGKLEFTLIGDTVNVAARVEQLTKTTGDAILLTRQTVDTLVSRPIRLIDRGVHTLKGKSAQVQLFGVGEDIGGGAD
jgi:adenylate cyclase